MDTAALDMAQVTEVLAEATLQHTEQQQERE